MDVLLRPDSSLAELCIGFAMFARLQRRGGGYRRVVQQHLTSPASPPP
ncbi:hypothetical protein [uncultured Devosia sp.]|nr:hypothetical protein [uncultured Devosia sp.]